MQYILYIYIIINRKNKTTFFTTLSFTFFLHDPQLVYIYIQYIHLYIYIYNIIQHIYNIYIYICIHIYVYIYI